MLLFSKKMNEKLEVFLRPWVGEGKGRDVPLLAITLFT